MIKLKKTVIVLFTVFLSLTSMAMPSDPVLIDYNLVGSQQTPYFEPRSLDLLVGQPYLFIINNPFPHAINVVFGSLGQWLHTHYLQGVPGMSQSSIMIPANGKVTWIFDINKPGNFEVFAINMGMGQKGQSSRINVQPQGGRAQFSAEELVAFEKLNQELQTGLNNQPTSTDKPEPRLTVKKSKTNKRPRLMGGRPDR